MRIAIPLADEAGTLSESFSRTGSFALYDVHDHTRAVSYLGRQSFDQPGCGRTPAFLRQHGVEVLLAHDVSEKAVHHLLEVGIVSIQDAPILPADALIAHLVSGTLQARPPLMAEQGCGSGGCGSCCGGGQAQAAQTCAGHGRADQGCADQSCGSHQGCTDHTCSAEQAHIAQQQSI